MNVFPIAYRWREQGAWKEGHTVVTGRSYREARTRFFARNCHVSPAEPKPIQDFIRNPPVTDYRHN